MDGSAVLVTEMVTCSIVVEAETETWRSTHQVKRKRQVTACKDGMRNDKSQENLCNTKKQAIVLPSSAVQDSEPGKVDFCLQKPCATLYPQAFLGFRRECMP